MTGTSPRDLEKAERERRVFRCFAARSGQGIDLGSIESRGPDEPDIRCTIDGREFWFELVEVCDPVLAKVIAGLKKQPGGGVSPLIWTSDPTGGVYLKKICKHYSKPVELLVHWDANTALGGLEDGMREHGCGEFRRIWYLGDEVCQEVTI
jgi:hypothetical protein